MICLDNLLKNYTTRHWSLYTILKWKRSSDREHILNLMAHFNVTEINGVVIDKNSQISFILESLPRSFIQFKMNYILNKLNYEITQLLNELQTFESIMCDKKQNGALAMLSQLHLLQRVRVRSLGKYFTLYCDNSGTVANLKEIRSYKRGKYIERISSH